jgi:hypothetical protein
MGYLMSAYFQIKDVFSVEKIIDTLVLALEDSEWRNKIVLTKKKHFVNDELHISLSVKFNDTYNFRIYQMTRKTNPYHEPPIPQDFYYLILSTDAFFFKNTESGDYTVSKEVYDAFLKFTKTIYLSIKPSYAVADHELDLEGYNYDFKNKIFWVNFFSPERVKEIGRERLLSAPAYQTEELTDGSIMLLATKNQGDAGPEIREKILKHLGFKNGV